MTTHNDLSGTGHKPRVLVVEDDPAVRLLLRDILSPFAGVVEADRPSLALSQIARRVPDAIVMDVCLPEYSGLKFLSQLRKNLGRYLPVVIVTANAYRISAQEAQDLGALNYFSKPFDPGLLAESIQKGIWTASHREIQGEPAWRRIGGLTGRVPLN